jgi:bifunctional lysine-specific demethylase and histidyl-hydroxylase NO66
MFFSDYWERKPLHVARPIPAFCRILPGIEDIDELIMLTSSDSGSMRLVRTAGGRKEEVPVTTGPGTQGDFTELYRRYDEGWTLIINSVHLRRAAIARLATGLRDAISHHVVVNVYFTPPKAQGFAVHADGHDVFLLQLAGRKRWRVFAPTLALPPEDQTVPIDAGNPGRCVLDGTTEPGNVLYIPRGFLHEGCSDDGASLHLTIGIHPCRWVDVVTEAVALAAERDVRLRESLPVGALAGGSYPPELEAKLVDLLRTLAEANVAAETLSRISRRQAAKSKPAPDGHFAAIDGARSLALDSLVQRRRGIDCIVRREGERALVEFGFNSVAGPAAIEDALQFVSRREEFRVGDLPDSLSEDSKIVLVRRLVKEGLLALNG